MENSVGGELVLDAVPIVTPNCDVVVPSLSLTVISIIIIFTIFIIIIVTLNCDVFMPRLSLSVIRG